MSLSLSLSLSLPESTAFSAGNGAPTSHNQRQQKFELDFQRAPSFELIYISAERLSLNAREFTFPRKRPGFTCAEKRSTNEKRVFEATTRRRLRMCTTRIYIIVRFSATTRLVDNLGERSWTRDWDEWM